MTTGSRRRIGSWSLAAVGLALAACGGDSGSSGLAIGTNSLPSAVINQPYDEVVSAGGGSNTSFTWTVVAGDLPDGLALVDGTPAATITGTPTTLGSETFTLQVVDSAGALDTQELTITVALTAPIRITSTTLPTATKGEFYSRTVSATGGTGPYTWDVAGGTLPAGLAITSGTPDGTISGTPTGNATSSFTLRVRDVFNTSDTQAFDLVVADLANGLLLHWQLDESLGIVAVDSSVHDRHGKLVNSPARVVGRFAQGLDFDWTDEAVDGGTTIGKVLPLSVAFWMNPRSNFVTQDLVRKGVCEDGSALGPPSGWGVRMNSDGRLAMVIENGNVSGRLTTSIPAIRNAWQHVLLTLRSTGGRAEVTFYRDGAFVNKLTSGFAFNGLVAREQLVPLLAGAGPGGLNPYDGLLDDVRIWSRVLSAAEAEALFDSVPAPPNDVNAPTTPANLTGRTLASTKLSLDWPASIDNVVVAGYRVFRGATQVGLAPGTAFLDTGLFPGTSFTYEVEAVDPFGNTSGRSPSFTLMTPLVDPPPLNDLVASWKLDEAFGITALDASGHGLDGTLSLGPTHVAARFGNGLDFNGASGVMNAGTPPELSRVLPLSVAFWIKPRDLTGTQDIVRKGIAEFGSSLGPPAGWAVQLVTPGLLDLVLDNGTNVPGDLVFNVPLQANVLQHVVITLRTNGGAAEVQLYLGGNLVDTFFSAFPFANFTRDDSLLPLLVGNGPNGATALDGVLDEIRIVKRVLTAAEVLDLFNGVK